MDFYQSVLNMYFSKLLKLCCCKVVKYNYCILKDYLLNYFSRSFMVM